MLYSNTKFRAYAAARFEEKNESGIPGSKKETHETPWSKTLGTKSSMGSRGGWDKHWGLVHRNLTNGVPKLKVAGNCRTAMRTSMIHTHLFQRVVRDRDGTQIYDLNCVIILT